MLVTDEKGRMVQVFRVNKPEYRLRPRISPLTCWRRARLCGKKLRRVHLTCFPCRLRRVVGAELPWIVPATSYILLLRSDRTPLKRVMSKLFCGLAEMFS
jgi:hypothetical protein